MNNSIDVPVVLLLLVAMFFWCLVTYTIGYKQGKADAIKETERAMYEQLNSSQDGRYGRAGRDRLDKY